GRRRAGFRRPRRQHLRAEYPCVDREAGSVTRLQAEDHHRRAAVQRERALSVAGGNRDVLLSLLLVRDYATRNRTAGVETVERRAGARTERQEIRSEENTSEL